MNPGTPQAASRGAGISATHVVLLSIMLFVATISGYGVRVFEERTWGHRTRSRGESMEALQR
jgi:hypothetical protein